MFGFGMEASHKRFRLKVIINYQISLALESQLAQNVYKISHSFSIFLLGKPYK